MSAPPPGSIGWHDLSVADARTVRDWYASVLGWRAVAVPMDGYDDYAMCPAGSEEPVAGICHARGPNADLPPVWLVYTTVADLDAALAAATRGGRVVVPARPVMGGRVAVIEDPAGAVMGLWEAPRG
ncbi:MAG: hypothetical protein RIR65_1475 [Planctomycetota bacterium]|jgi:predicted enzyme related to lactoylglutathione lyase